MIAGIEPVNSGEHHEAEVSGKWAEIIFIPDLVTDERLNIGVCFKEAAKGEFHFRLADSLDMLSAIYGNGYIEQFGFLLESARAHFSLHGDSEEFSPHVVVGRYRSASGFSIQEILDEQFDSMVTIARHR